MRRTLRICDRVYFAALLKSISMYLIVCSCSSLSWVFLFECICVVASPPAVRVIGFESQGYPAQSAVIRKHAGAARDTGNWLFARARDYGLKFSYADGSYRSFLTV
jgi:hypothetical protein